MKLVKLNFNYCVKQCYAYIYKGLMSLKQVNKEVSLEIKKK